MTIKWLAKVTIVTGGIALLVGTISFSLYPNQLFEIKLMVNKYIALNLNKSRGIHEYFLQTAAHINQFLPEPQFIEFERTEEGAIGASPVYGSYTQSPFLTQSVLKVNSSKQLIHAVENAKAGNTIVITPGHYSLTQHNIKTGYAGTEEKPIVLKATHLDSVTLHLNSNDGLLISQPNWIIENIVFKGDCETDSQCEHAIHLVGNADNTLIQFNRFMNFNAHIKSNGLLHEEHSDFPDNVKVIGNDFINDYVRKTSNPVTPIDVIGGNNWHVAHNFIADFSKTGYEKFNVTYGAYLKGAGENGKIENNLVICEWKLPHYSALDVRIGISLGGGGTEAKYCQDRECNFEHKSGNITGNQILNCKNDVSIYLNKSTATVNNNHLLNTLGIDVRYPQSQANVNKNTIQGRIRARDGGNISIKTNNNILMLRQ